MSRVLLCGFAFLYAHVLSSGHARRHAPVCFEYVYIYIYIYKYIYIYYSMLLNWLHVYIHLQLDRNECSKGRVLHLLRRI